MIYKELVVYIDMGSYDEVIADLLTLDFESFIEGDDALYAYIPSDKFSGTMIPHIQKRLRDLEKRAETNSPVIHLRDILPKNWHEEWQRSITPVQIGKNIIIHPSWSKPEIPDGTTSIVIDPKMSFGTGHHETTQMMVELLLEFHRPGMKILDVGTGSGILAIISAKIGSHAVVGIDNDPDAVADAQENITLNGVETKVRLFPGNLDALHDVKSQRFDMLLANIERRVIIQYFELFTGCLQKEGLLLLSGLLADDLPAIKNISRDNNLSIMKQIKRSSSTSDKWLAIALKK